MMGELGRGFHVGQTAEDFTSHMATQSKKLPEDPGLYGDAQSELSHLIERAAGRLTEEEAAVLIAVGALLYRAGLREFLAAPTGGHA